MPKKFLPAFLRVTYSETSSTISALFFISSILSSGINPFNYASSLKYVELRRAKEGMERAYAALRYAVLNTCQSNKLFCQFFSPQEMHMKVEDDLPAIFITVDNRSETSLSDALEFRNPLYSGQHGGQALELSGLNVHKSRNMPFGNDDNVDRCCRVDVMESQYLVILVYLIARHLAFNNPAEYAIIHRTLPPFTLQPVAAFIASLRVMAPEYSALPTMTPAIPDSSISTSFFMSSTPATPPEAITGMLTDSARAFVASILTPVAMPSLFMSV